MINTNGWSLSSAAEQIRSGALAPEQLLDRTLAAIAKSNPRIHAYLSVDEGAARERINVLKRQPPRGKLYGVPVLIKDNICVRGQLTTCGSNILEGFHPPYNATVVDRLEAEGAVILGRANMDEFAFGSSTETSCYGITKNPWDVGRVPGGSSGGSAAAVAARLALGALGTDTGGSIRQPAAFCGVVGLKPTYGRVSRYGLIAFASSLDQIGPITNNVRDAALLLEVLAGHDPMDSTSAEVEVEPYTQRLRQDLKGLRIGTPKEYFLKGGIDSEVNAAIEQAITVLTKLGATCRETSLPHTNYAVAAYYLVATAEASSNLARFDGVQYGHRAGHGSRITGHGSRDGQNKLFEMYAQTREEGFGAEAKRRIMLGTFALSHGYYDAYYLKGLKTRALIKQDFDRAFQEFDCLVTPTSPTAAFRIGEKMQDPLTMYLSDIYTISANLAGVPALSLPCGFTKTGLPIGMQLLAAPFRETTLFQAGHAYEQATDWHLRKPATSDQRPATT